MTKKQRFLAYAATKLLTLYGKTWRYRRINKEKYDELREQGKCVVLTLWHDQLLPCTFSHRNEGMTTIASDSKDGGLITYALGLWGFNTARGSSSRGGAKAAISAIKLAREKKSACAVTVDGPRGPRHVVKNGAIFIAKKLDCVIITGIMHTKHAIRFKSWDKFILPLPFARIEITYSDPMYVSAEMTEEAMAEDTERVQKLMTELTSVASPLFI